MKPEFWTDEKILSISIPARLFFIGLWNWSDDNGVLENKAVQLKARIFPCDNVEIGKLIIELSTVGLIKKYKNNNQEYLLISNFLKHQILDRPRKSNLPLPENIKNQMKSNEIMLGREGKGREEEGKGNGKEENIESKALKFKNQILSLQNKFKTEWDINLPFYKTKYSFLDLDFQWENILDWINREPKKAQKSSIGNLNLFYQRWLNKEKPQFKGNGRGYPATILSNSHKEPTHEQQIENQKVTIKRLEDAIGLYTDVKDEEKDLDPPSIKKLAAWRKDLKEAQAELTALEGK